MAQRSMRVIYCSTVTSMMEKDSFIDMVRQSVANNKKLNLTGILLFDGTYFFQVLEGDGEKVNAMIAKIGLDPRHANIQVLSSRQVEARLFPKWSMELIDANNDFFDATYGGRFDPYTFSDKKALECATNAKAWRIRRLQTVS